MFFSCSNANFVYRFSTHRCSYSNIVVFMLFATFLGFNGKFASHAVTGTVYPVLVHTVFVTTRLLFVGFLKCF